MIFDDDDSLLRTVIVKVYMSLFPCRETVDKWLIIYAMVDKEPPAPWISVMMISTLKSFNTLILSRSASSEPD
ncbi:hypothetical protein TNCT_590721 [Trichonephila clavata]|uniref:Uncharacterized protein n=1 Tax=Trichonephila clavata TaxID=2740835 RepID=A0A8X6LF08_TRICU|nr:hypothetical protein TNCT_590721 [Trichonephila clavata]